MNPRTPLVVAMDMGYGHLRAAAAIAEVAGTGVIEADRAPLADPEEQASWRRARALYEGLSRSAGWPFLGPALGRALDAVTAIPKMRSSADLRAPNAAARMLRRMGEQGLGRGLVAHVRATGRPLVSTFYAPAILAAQAGCRDVTLVVTDVDVNRVWVPEDPVATPLTYCVPAERAAERLRRYGVPADRVVLTGFPLPPGLVGADLATARDRLASRLARLDASGAFRRAAAHELATHGIGPGVRDDAPPLVVLAVGGAGAQVELAAEVLAALAGGAVRGAWRLALVAGVRTDVADAFRQETERLGLAPRIGRAVEILHAPTIPAYLAAFESLLARADVLWTKPSELTFYGALGLPLLLSRPLGTHEKANRRWALERGAAADARSGDAALVALERGLADGSLAAAAWSGFLGMPKLGAWRVLAAAAGAGA